MFQRNTILPWVKRWEAEFNRKLFVGDSEYYIRFNMDGLLRGDIRSRYEAYTKGSRQWGWIQSANDDSQNGKHGHQLTAVMHISCSR